MGSKFLSVLSSSLSVCQVLGCVAFNNQVYDVLTVSTGSLLTAYRLNSLTGELTLLSGFPVTDTVYWAGPTADPKFLFLSRGANGSSTYSVSNGLNIIQTASGNHVYSSVFSIDRSFAFVSHSSGTSLETYSLTPSGGMSLSSTHSISIGGGTVFKPMAVDPLGRFLAVIWDGAAATGDAWVLNIGTGGSLSLASTVAYPNMTEPLWHPSGNWLFLRPGGIMYAYPISSAGSLGSSTSVNPGSQGYMAINPAGTYLFATGTGPVLLSYSFDSSSGAMSQVSSIVTTAVSPRGIRVDSSGSWLFLVNNTDSTIEQYSIGASGALTRTQSISTSGSPSIELGPLAIGR